MTERETFIILLDNDNVQPSDVIVLLEGDGFNRVDKTIELFNEGYGKNIVVSGGLNKPEQGSIPASELKSVLIEKGITETSIIVEENSLNTYEQAAEVMKLSQFNGWKKIIIVASHYHQYRAFLTFLKAVLHTNREIRLYNAPACSLSWYEPTPWGKRIDLLRDEFLKIEKYREAGHTASYAEAIEYLEWKKN